MGLRDAFRAIEEGFSGKIEYDVPLARVAYYRIGGPARVLVEPRTFEDLLAVHGLLRATRAPFSYLDGAPISFFLTIPMRG